MNKKLVFLCGARDFHAMDWFRSAKMLLPEGDIVIVTDLIAGEGYKKITQEKDHVHKLLILDKLLFKQQSKWGDIWRNVLKLMVLPLQVLLLRKFAHNNKNCVYHAHSMYYLVLARAAGLEYVGTPQGSDILVKPYKSKFYLWFSKYGLKKAKYLTVDSVKMQNGIKNLVNREAIIIQNGIDIKAINEYNKLHNKETVRNGLLSIRGFTSLYRIMEILKSRESLKRDEKITFIYPFEDAVYRGECRAFIRGSDVDLGRVERHTMYQLISNTKLVISIPYSDSSPRSVYESIFCGAPVAITYNSYYDILPDCMKKRIIIIDINDERWLKNAVDKAESIIKESYKPTADALNMFDQDESAKKMLNLLFY